MATPPIQTGPDNSPTGEELLEQFEIFRKSRSISGPDPRRQRTPLHPPDPTPTREFPQGRPEAFRPEGQPEFGRSFIMPAGPPEDPEDPEDLDEPKALITPRLPSGDSPTLTVAGRTGHFEFRGGGLTDRLTPGTRYVFKADDGQIFNFQLEEEFQGGRWEQAPHAAADYRRWSDMEPEDAKKQLDQAWGRTEPNIVQTIEAHIKARAPFSTLQKSLAGLNTHRQISGYATGSPPLAKEQDILPMAGGFPLPEQVRRRKELEGTTWAPIDVAETVRRIATAKGISQRLPWAGGWFQWWEAGDILNATRAVERESAGGQKATEVQWQLIEDLDRKMKEDHTFLAGVVEMASHIPGFAVEFMSTGGVYTAFKEISSRTVNKLLRNAISKAVLRRSTAAAAGFTGGALAQATVAGGLFGRIPLGAQQRRTADWTIQDGQFLITEEGDDIWTASLKAFGDNFIEFMSERAGGAIPAGKKWLGGTRPGQWAAGTAPAVKVQALKRAITERWLKTHPGQGINDLLTKVRVGTGWHGVLGEMFEERVGGEARRFTGLLEGETVSQQFAREGFASPEAWNQLATEALAFAIPGAASAGLRQLPWRKPPKDPSAEPGEGPVPEPPRKFSIDDKLIVGIWGDAPAMPNRVVLEDGTLVRRNKSYIGNLKNYGYPLLSQDQLDSLKPGAKPIDVTAEEVPAGTPERPARAPEAPLPEGVEEKYSTAISEGVREGERWFTSQVFNRAGETVFTSPETKTRGGAENAAADYVAATGVPKAPPPPPAGAAELKPTVPEEAPADPQVAYQQFVDKLKALNAPEEQLQYAQDYYRYKAQGSEGTKPTPPQKLSSRQVTGVVAQIDKFFPEAPPAAEEIPPVAAAPAEPIFPKDAADAARERLRAKRGEGAPEPPAATPEEQQVQDEADLAAAAAAVMTPLPPDVAEEATQDEPLNPKVEPLIHALNAAGVRTMLSGDLYGDEVIYVDIDQASSEKIGRQLPEGWDLLPRDASAVDKWLGKELTPFQEEQLAKVKEGVDGARLVRKGSEPVSIEDISELMSIFTQKGAEEAAREGAPEPPADLISPEEARKQVAETPEMKEAEQGLLDNAARLRAEAEADVEDARDRVTARREGEAEENEKLAAATADLKKYTRDLGDEEALFGMAYRKWRLGGEFSVREDDPAVLESVFEWAQENPDSEQNIRSKTDAIVGQHKVGREGSIGDIRRAFYRLTAKARKAAEAKADEELPIPEGGVEIPSPLETATRAAEAFAQFAAFMDEQAPGTTFTLSRKDVPEISQVDKTPLDFDKWEGEYEQVVDPHSKSRGGPLRWINKRTGNELVSRAFAPIGSIRMSDALARSKRLKAAEKPPEIPDLGQEDDFAAKMNRYPEGTQFTITADDTKHIPDLLHGLPLAKQLVGEWEKVLLTPGSGSTGVWKKTAGTPLPTVGPVPSAFFVDALDEDGMSSVLKRNTLMGLIAGKFIYDAPLKPSKAKEPVVTPQLPAMEGMTPLGLPKDPIKADDRVEWIKEGDFKGRRGNIEWVDRRKDQWGRPVDIALVVFTDKSEKGVKKEINVRHLKKVSFAPETAIGADAISGAVEQLQKEMEAEDVTEAEKPQGPAPGRTLRIGRGANGQVAVVFNRKDDADLFAAVGRMRRKMQKKGGPEGPGWPRLRELYPEGAGNIAVFSQDYRDEIMEAIKGLPEGETFQAPRPTLRKPPEVAPLPGTEAPPPPAGEHPSVQLQDDYIAELHVPGPGSVYMAPNYADQYFANRRLGGQLGPGSRPPGMTEEDAQRIESRIDSFFPDIPLWKEGDTAIWEGKEVEISKIQEPKERKVTKVEIGTRPGDLEQFDATVGMNELTQPATEAKRGSTNTIFTEDKANEARERLRKKARGDQLNIGFDPKDIADMFSLGGFHFEAGARDFGTWSKKMIEDVGEWVRPMLQGSFDMIKQSYEAEVAKTAKATLPEPPKEPTIEGGVPTDAGTQRPIQDPEVDGPDALEAAPPQDAGRAQEGGEGGRAPGQPGELGDQGDRLAGEERPAEPGPDQGDRAPDVHIPPGRVGQNPNFYRAKADEIGLGTKATKASNNVTAIETLLELQESGDIPTPEQLDTLNRFTGWGQLKRIFERYGPQQQTWESLYHKLRKLLSDGEYKGARRSTLNAHYTSPELVKFMWEVVQKMGFEGGKVLEPSMGIGNFLGLAPDSVVANSKFVGVELDNMTGSMAKMLYPGADIFVKGFEEVYLPNESFDLVISNVPFGNYKVYDPSYKHDNIKSIHDYFIIKSLDKAKPGGLVVVITSMYTMDKQTTRMREMMASRADLVEAFRLPNNAFAKNAGTQVTTDLLIFRKRAATETRGGQSFVDLAPYVARGSKDAPEGTVNTKKLNINEYFQRNPGKMLGTMSARGTMYGGKDEPTLDPEGDLTELLGAAMKAVPEGVFGAAATTPDAELDQTLRTAPDDVKEGAFTIDAKGQIKQRVRGILVDPDVIIPKRIKKKRLWIKQHSSQIKQLINLREQIKAVLRIQLATEDDDIVSGEQKKLNRLYDQYKNEFGLLHDDSTRELFSPDPQYPLMLALETYDPESETATKADIFNKRTLFPNKPLESVSTDPQESLLQVLGQTGRADIDLITSLSEKPREQIVSELEDLNLVFENPETGQHEIAEQYLSEYVKDKLEIAERAAEGDPKFQRNVDALKEVQPEIVPINGPDLKKLILVRLGSSWIPPVVIKDFIRHLDDSPGKITVTYGRPTTRKGTKVKVDGVPKKWIVKFPDRASVANTRRWSGGGITAQKLLTIALNLGTPKVVVRTSAGTHLDPEATLAAKAKMQEIKNEFEKWARTEPKWGPRLEKRYNDAMNKIRNRSFDGAHMVYPGMNAAITMQPHQNNGVWRIIAAGRGLLAHPVGSGKTFEMIAAAMEMRRMGMVKKSLFAVPNHLVEYWHNEFQRLYPGANVLSPNEDDFTPPKRQQFFSRIATGDWDAVIIAQSHIEMIPVSKEREIRLLRAELNEATEALEAGRRDGDRHFIRRMENTLAALEAKLKELIDRPKDDTILFEDMGIDMLFVDEAHNYKNLFFYTKMGTVSGLGQSPSGRATAMKLKTDYLLEQNNNRGVVFATATPISNTMAEMYTMTRFLAPDVYVAAGITNFDEWAANFGETVEVSELSPDAQSYHQRTKFSRFNNMPEMINQFRFYADVLEVEGLGLRIPPLKGGRPMPVKVPSHELLDNLFRYIVSRAERLRGGGVDKREDNWLKLTHDAKLISLDARMYSGPGSEWIDHPDSKVNHAVEQIYQRWENSKSLKGTQMVFIDNFQNTLKDAETKKVTRVLINLYDDMTEKLIARGVPAEDIAKIHDFEGSKEKQRAFDKMNAGKIRILFGTRMKMGEGTNAQERMVALHNLDQPWKPSQYDQGNGRILRQGNRLYDEGLIDSVEIPQYLTEKSFDAYMFQALETKAKFIHAAMSGQVLDRTMLDVAADVVLNYSELKALASGNPDVKVQLDLSIEHSRLQTLQNEHFWERHRSKNQIDGKRSRILEKSAEIRLLQKAQEIWAETDNGEIFSAVINGVAFDDVKKAASYIHDNPEGAPSISLYGFDLKITQPTTHMEGGVPIRPEGPIGSYKVEDLFYRPQYVFAGHREISPSTEEGLVTSGIIQSIKMRGSNLQGDITREEAALVRLNKDVVDLQELSVEEFPYATELEDITAKLEAVEIRLGMRPDPEDESASPDGESDEGEVTVRDETDKPPETPDVGGIEMAETAPAPPVDTETIRIAVGEEMVPTPATKVADGLFVHINPAKEEGEDEEGRLWSVTHGPSGQAIDNESETEGIATLLAQRLAALGDWMRSSAELAADSDFAKAVQRLLKDERGFIRLDFWNKGPKKQTIDKEELKSPDPLVEEALNATARTGKKLWDGLKDAPRQIHESFGAKMFFEFTVREYPRLVEALRRFSDAPLDAARQSTNRIKQFLKPLDQSQYEAFRKIAVGKDIRENLRRGIPQGTLTFEQMDAEVDRLERIAGQQVLDAVDAHDAMMQEIGEDLVARGKMSEEDLRAHYFPNRVIDYINELDAKIPGLPKRLKTPNRWYTKQRKGSKGWHDADYLDMTHRYLMKVALDNMTDDFVDEVAVQFDAMVFVTPDERTELFGAYGKPLPGKTYTLADGREYKGWQYKEGNVFYPGRTVNEEVLLEALAQEMSAEEWLESETETGSQAVTEALIMGGKHKTYLLPAEIADRLTEFKTSERSLFARAFVPYMTFWKRMTLDFAGIPFQVMNLVGDEINLFNEDIGAVLKHPQAIRMLLGRLNGPQEEELMELAKAHRVIASSALWFEAAQASPYEDPELRHITGAKGFLTRHLAPFPGAKGIERASAFRESVPRLSKFIADMERINRGESVVVKSTSIKGLEPIESAAKAARNFTVDYGAVSPAFKNEIRGWMFPFATFWFKNFNNYYHRVKGHPKEMFLKNALPYAAMTLWNHKMFPECEENLGDWWKFIPHICTGYKTSDGKDIVIAIQTPVDMAASMVGLDRLPSRIADIATGKVTIKEAALGQIEDTLLGMPREAWKLLNPFAKMMEGVLRNKDPFTGRQIVPDGTQGQHNLWGDRREYWPQTKKGQELMVEFIMRTILTPYAQYVRTSRLQEPGEGVTKFITRGPFDIYRAVGYREVDLTAGERAKWYDDRYFAEGILREKLYDVEDIYLSYRRGDLTNKQYVAQRKAVLARPGPGPNIRELTRLTRSSRVRIMVLQDQLRAEEDPKKRQAIIKKLDNFRYQQQRGSRRNLPRSIRRDVDQPRRARRDFGGEAPAPPP